MANLTTQIRIENRTKTMIDQFWLYACIYSETPSDAINHYSVALAPGQHRNIGQLSYDQSARSILLCPSLVLAGTSGSTALMTWQYKLRNPLTSSISLEYDHLSVIFTNIDTDAAYFDIYAFSENAETPETGTPFSLGYCLSQCGSSSNPF